MTMERDSLAARLTRAGGAMSNILYNMKQAATYGTEELRQRMDKCQTEWDAALQAFQEGSAAAALSRPEQAVKALEWVWDGPNHWKAGAITGSYHIVFENDAFRLRLSWSLMKDDGVFDSIDAAKAAAQAIDEAIRAGAMAGNMIVGSALHPAPEAASAGAAGKVKPLDLSILIRDAFLSGRGLKDGDKLSEADQAAFMEYDPTEYVSYKRIYAALYPSLTPSDTAPSPKGVSDGVRAAVKPLTSAIQHIVDENEDFRVGMPGDWAGDPLQDAIEDAHKVAIATLAALSQEPVPATAEERAASKEGA